MWRGYANHELWGKNIGLMNLLVYPPIRDAPPGPKNDNRSNARSLSRRALDGGQFKPPLEEDKQRRSSTSEHSPWTSGISRDTRVDLPDSPPQPMNSPNQRLSRDCSRRRSRHLQAILLVSIGLSKLNYVQ